MKIWVSFQMSDLAKMPILCEMLPMMSLGFSSLDHFHSIVFTYSPDDEPSTLRQICGLDWCRERLPVQHPEAYVVSYECEDPHQDLRSENGIDEAATTLLSQLELFRLQNCVVKSASSIRNADACAVDPTLPLIFIGQGIAGLIIKRVCHSDGQSKVSSS